ncbi:hypothetical protein FRC06_000862 [Ceratobasidium sp. 370]|nr:hypothetical protein FRC06_000862 [Ceratobasidium sp. 370]
MPPRSTPPPHSRGGFQPPNDASTFKDLLHFEERLKINAAKLKKRKRRYQVFLVQLTLVILILTSDVLLETSFLMLPVNLMAPYLDEKIRDPLLTWWFGHSDPSLVVPRITIPVVPHPYLTPGVWLVAVMTLVLFFASGLYSERISYANRYVPQANRALRSFNIHLNVRTQPKGPPAPLSYLFPRPAPSPPSPTNTQPNRKGLPRKAPLNPIPPTTNPRGELIFSSRVDRAFRESYERYRAVWERKREEHLAANRRSWFSWPPWFTGAKPGTGAAGGKEQGRNTPTPVSSRPPSRRSSPAGSVRRNRTRTPELPGSPLAQTEPGERTTPRLSTVPEAGVPDTGFPTGSSGERGAEGDGGDDRPDLVRSRTESFSFLLQRQDSLSSS